MFEIRYCDASSEVEITASATAFGQLSLRIADFVQAADRETVIPVTASSDVKPFERFLSELNLCKTEAPLLISVSRHTLEICGSPEALELLARNLPSDSALPRGYHVHYERVGREALVSIHSLNLVLCIAA